MEEAEVPTGSIEAWALPPRARQGRPRFSGQTVVVVARVDGRYYAVRSRLPPEGRRLQGFLLWQTLSLKSEEHTSELQSLMRISYAVFCLKKKNNTYMNIAKLHRIQHT